MSQEEIQDWKCLCEIIFPLYVVFLDILILNLLAFAAVFLLSSSQRERIHQTVRAELWCLPVDFLLMMFEILSAVLFSVRAISLIVVLFISRSAAPRASLRLLIGWLVCLCLNTFFHAHCSGKSQYVLFGRTELYRKKIQCALIHRWRCQNQCSFILSSSLTPYLYLFHSIT